MHGVEDARQGGEGGFEGFLVFGVVGQQAQRGADQGIGLAQLAGHAVEAAAEGDAARPRHEQPEGDGLGVAVGKGFVAGAGEQQLAPVGGEVGERAGAVGQLLGHFLAQQAAEPGGQFGERGG